MVPRKWAVRWADRMTVGCEGLTSVSLWGFDRAKQASVSGWGADRQFFREETKVERLTELTFSQPKSVFMHFRYVHHPTSM